MFDISKDQLRLLNDTDLRELVARLCQAELRIRGAPVSAVKWGGSQNAPDGGLDVDCRLEDQRFSGDFVPRARTGIQVKTSSMSASRISDEMSPDGIVRPIFFELAREKGCYIIVSLADDPAGTMLGQRSTYMRDEVCGIENHNDLRLEFYGRGHLENWLREHPGVELWVRKRLGIPAVGWRPHGRWTTTPATESDELICKPGVVIRLPGKEQILSVDAGIEGIRQLIRDSGKAVRIVGLSGVGKTRIVQALFEESVGTNPLDRNLAVYADLGESPKPSAQDVVEQLIADARSALVVLDNCPSATHSGLASKTAEMADIRLITIEHDIRDDKPQLTDVVRIDAEGPGIAEALVNRRYPALGQINAERIAVFSDGNVRLALALADAVYEADSLSKFSNRQLFERLFYQGGARDDKLLAAAEVLSLVYSFSISNGGRGEDELSILAGLVDHTRLSLHRSVQQLVERQLVQKRANWRAVLPQALSNRLAAKALRNIPIADILAVFDGSSPRRLSLSFGRRLGNLHDHEVAHEIVNRWISQGGRLYDFGNLSEQNVLLLQNVAPVAPESVLAGIEREAKKDSAAAFFSTRNPHYSVFADLLTSLAYEVDLFDRCIDLLTKFAVSEQDGDQSIRDHLFSLFSLYLSGTQASPNQREQAVRVLLTSEDGEKRRIGMGMMQAALRSDHWTSIQSFEFGARPRSFGYEPRTVDERDKWFEIFIGIAKEAATGDIDKLSDEARTLLADEFQGLWENPGLRGILADLAKALNENRTWLQGWRSVRSIKYFEPSHHHDDTPVQDLELLETLDEMLRPENLVDEIRAYVLSAGAEQFSLEDEFDLHDEASWKKSRQRAAERARDLGRTAAHDPGVLAELSEELCIAESQYLTEFGQGLAGETGDLQTLWNQLTERQGWAGDKVRQCGILIGVLKEMYDRDCQAAWKTLDEAVTKASFQQWIVELHASIPLGPDGGARLIHVLNDEYVPIQQFETTVWNWSFDDLSGEELKDILLRVLTRPGGAKVVLSGLSMRLSRYRKLAYPVQPEIRQIGLSAAAALLRDVPTLQYGPMIGHHLSRVLDGCLDEGAFPVETGDVLDAFFFRLNQSYGLVSSIEDAVKVLAERMTIRFLDGIFFHPGIDRTYMNRVFHERRKANSPLSNVLVQSIFCWCDQGDFRQRLRLVARIVDPFVANPETGDVVFSEQAFELICASKDPAEVLNIFSRCGEPAVVMGSRAQLTARRARAFESLLSHGRPEIRAAAKEVLVHMKERAHEATEGERINDERRAQTFE